jgi:pimeloyl-[acyl-carrier protein] synthase
MSVPEAAMGWVASDVDYNPFTPEFHRDPYPFYRRLREADPVHWNPPGIWVLTRHADAVAMLRHPRMSSDFRNSDLYEMFRQMQGIDPSTERTPSMLFRDPPDHTRLRGLVTKAFTSKRIDDMRPTMHAIVDGLIDAALERGEMDVVADLAYPLPVKVICGMLGVPEADHGRFHAWSRDLVATLDPMVGPEAMNRAMESGLAFDDYFRDLIASRRTEPRDDLLSALISAEEEGGRLTEEELLTQLVLLLVAGHETTVNLISNGTLALLQHPGQLERLRNEPALLKPGVEELLRYYPPVQLTGRIALQDMEFGGSAIRRGMQVVALVGAANRDPAAFTEPDRLDLSREPNRHIAFGGGIHHCLGSSLARAEGQVALGTLVRRARSIELRTDEPLWKETITLRGLAALPVRVAA